MTHLSRSLVMLALWGGLVLPAAARADESAENTSAERALSSRVGELESEIATLRQQMNGAVQGQSLAGGGDYGASCGGASQCGCGDCCCGCWHAPCCSCGFYGGGEVMWAQPRWRAFDAVTVTTVAAVTTS